MLLRQRGGAVCGALAVMSLCGLTSCRAPETKSSRTLHYAISEPVATLQPPTLRGLADQQLLRLLYDPLVHTDARGRTAPALATRWTSTDGQTWTFTIGRGRTFHDGAPITARDVVRSWTALGSYRDKAPLAPLLEDIEGMPEVLAGRDSVVRGLSAPDDTTLVVRLRQPRAAFPLAVSRPEYGIVATTSTPTRPVGSGRWKWVRGRVGDSLLVLARFDSTLVTPADTLELIVVPAPELASRMASGALDCTGQILPSLITSFVLQPSLSIQGTTPAAMTRLSLRGSNPALRDRRVRQALAYALDLASIARSTGESQVRIEGRRLTELVSEGVPARAAAPYDPARARALLHEAGADSLRLRISLLPYAISGDTLRDFIYRVRDYWEAVGLQVEIVRPKEFWRAIADSSADVQPQYYFTSVPNGAEYMARAYSSESPMARLAPTLAEGAQINALLDSARATLDQALRTAFLVRADELLATEVPDVLLWHAPLMSAKRTTGPSCTVGLFTDDQLLRDTRAK